MSLISSVFMSILFFGLLPIVLGQIWKGTIENGGIVYTYLSGGCTILAVFELLSVPLVFLYVPFHIQVVLYSVVFCVIAVLNIYKERAAFSDARSIPGSIIANVKSYFSSLSLYEWIYFASFIGLLVLQLYYSLFYDVGNWRSDDGTYAVFSSAAIHDDMFYRTDIVTGEFSTAADMLVKYGMCGIYVFYAYAAVITGLGVAVIQQTICQSLFILSAYGCFYLLSKLIFPDNKDRDNRLIFLILVAIAFIFGYHSRFSLTFRLLGTIWQGKAVLATVITPFLLAIYPRFIEDGITKKKLILLTVVSLSAISLTLGGVIVIGVIPGLISFLHTIRTKQFKMLVYLPAMWVFPMIIMLCYLALN